MSLTMSLRGWNIKVKTKNIFDINNEIKKIQKEQDAIHKSLSERRIASITEHEFLNRNVFFSYMNWAMFIIISGARDYGKSFFIMDYLLQRFFKHGECNNFWFRLTPTATEKLLKDNGKKLIDVLLIKKYNLYDKKDENGVVIQKAIKRKGDDIYIFGKKFCTVLPVSTFYNNKGESLFDATILTGARIVFDEFQREQSEKNAFDICYCFVNQLENVARDNPNTKVWLLGNTLSEVSDILTMFNFIPHDFGIYKIKKKKAVIFNLPNSEKYIARRQNSPAQLLLPEASTFTNKIENLVGLISKETLRKPNYVIVFSPTEKYTLWNGRVIKRYNKEKVPFIPMKPFISDYVYIKKNVDMILLRSQQRTFLFTDLITQKKFDNQIQLLKNIK